HSIDAVEALAWKELEQLTTHDGCGPQLLIEAGLVHNVVLFEQTPNAGERQVITSERGAFIAGNKCPGAQTSAGVTALLIHGQPHQGLNASEVDATLSQCVLLVKCQSHGGSLLACNVTLP